VTASVSNFVPKPHTPFQWTAQLPADEMEARQRFLGRELRRRRITFRWHDPTLSFLEGIFSRGDRRTGALVRRAYELGCRFDGWTDGCRIDLWKQALCDTGLAGDFYLRRRLLDEPLPWDHLGSGVTKTFLQRELARAFEHTLTPDCSVERCTYCGACDFSTIRNVDYHLRGAKAAEHRGATVDHWASNVVPADASEGAWEPRGWQKVHGALANNAPGPTAPPAWSVDTSSLPASAQGPPGRGLGNADEWMAAAGEALGPVGDASSTTVRARLRFTYRKLDLARFIGGRELATLFYRAGRRAGLPVAFSAGYHPLPRLSFGPALPVGVESQEEFVDIDLTQSLQPHEACRALAGQFPSGIEIISAWPVPLKGPSVSSLIVACRYRVDIAPLLNGGGWEPIRARLTAFEASARFPVRKHVKGQMREVDAKPYVESLELEGPATLTVAISSSAKGTLKPADLLGPLLGLDDGAARALRVMKVANVFDSGPPVASGEAAHRGA
jgi:radical SAM-linked protein